MLPVLRKSVFQLRRAGSKTASTVACIQTRSYATEFFKLPKNKKKGDKGDKKEGDDKQKQLEKYFENVSEEERARILEFEDTRSKQEEQALKHKQEERGRLEAIEYQNFLYWAKKMRADLEQRVAHANDPCFSEEARKKAYELHKKNPNYWTASRLSNLFKMRVDRMKLYLWSSKIEEQAEADGVILDDTIDRLLAKKFGETAFPQDIPDIPDEIPIRKNQSPSMWFWIDGDVKSGELLKFIRRREAKYYRESPKTPKKKIPEVKYITEKMYLPGYQPKIYPNKYPVKMVMWDISPTSDMYNRAMVVRETDGQWRTGNWEERRWAEDYRRYIKRPFLTPYPKIDESQPNKVPVESQLPDDYQKYIAEFKF